MPKLVRDLMHPGPITCQPSATLGQVAVMLHHHRVHALFVVDQGDMPIGVITDFDLLAGEWLSADPESLAVMRRMTAGELMTTPVETVEATAPAVEAAQRMAQASIRRLLVTEDGKPTGVISISDFLPMLAARSLGRRTVADVMSPVMLVCRDSTPVSAVARGLVDSRYRAVLVVSAEGRPVGIVSGLDLIGCFKDNGDCDDRTAGQVMHPMFTAYPTDTLQEAANKMITHHHHRLVVVDPNEPDAMPLGIISSVDIVAQMAQPGSVWQQ